MEKVVVDARGLQCPMPLLKAKQALNRIGVGDVVEVIATDAGSWRDFHVFAAQCDHELLLAEEVNGEFRYQFRKGHIVPRYV